MIWTVHIMFLHHPELHSLLTALQGCPQAEAKLSGSRDHSRIYGFVYFYQTPRGVLTAAQVWGLPTTLPGNIFGFHIHSGGQCSGNEADPFADALTHYNPTQEEHPFHAGDLPSLFGNNGYALQVFLTDRFSVHDIIGKTVIIHSGPDDFTSQPAGNAGARIACGQIKPYGPC